MPLQSEHFSGLPQTPTYSETGFVYLRNRYYDPTTGQFLMRDPIEALTQKPYLYASGDPIEWAALGFFVVRPLVGLVLFTVGIVSVTGIVLAMIVAEVTWFVLGRIVKRLVVDPCNNQWQ